MINTNDPGVLQAALIGYGRQVEHIQTQIRAIERRLKKRKNAAARPAVATAPRKHPEHRISPEGRARIAAAQRKRWAEAKKNTNTKTKTA